MSGGCPRGLSTKIHVSAGEMLSKLQAVKIVLSVFNVMLAEDPFHKGFHGFSFWPWSAGQLNVFLLNSCAAVLTLSNLFSPQYNCSIASCHFSQVMLL